MLLKVQIQGKLKTLANFAGAMNVTEFFADEETRDAGELHGEMPALNDHASFSVVELLAHMAKKQPIVGRFHAIRENSDEDEFGKFAFDGTRTMELETDRWGSFTFPDAGSVHDFPDFLAREQKDMLEFLAFREKVLAEIFPTSALYHEALHVARVALGDNFALNEKYADLLAARVRELHAQDKSCLRPYGAMHFIVRTEGKDGLAFLANAAGIAAEV